MENETFDFLQKYHYSNSFWENSDVLFNHSRDRMKEYEYFSDKISDIAITINKFSDSLLNITKIEENPNKEDYISSRTNAISCYLKFINKLAKYLKILYNNYKDVASVMKDKLEAYKSRHKFEDLCNQNFDNYKKQLNKVNKCKQSYKESAECLVEIFLNSKYKDAKYGNDINPKKEVMYKKENEYKAEVKKCEDIRNDYITLQRQILDDEETFDLSVSETLKDNLIKLMNFHKDFMYNCKTSKELIEAIANINGHKDIQEFSDRCNDIISYPPGTTFSVYNQNLELYFSFEVIKNILKTKNEMEQREFKRELSIEVSKFLGDILTKDSEKKQKVERFAEIANNILNKKSNEEECNFVIKEFENCSNNSIQPKRKTSSDKKDAKDPTIGGWENEFDCMHDFLNIFNKLRQFNKKMEKENFDYFVKINEKIIELIDSDDKEKTKNKYREEKEIDYNLCDLLLILSSTFYMTEQKDGKEEKIYVYQKIKHCKLFQRYEFWVNIVKSQLSEQIITEKMNEENEEKKEKKKKKGLLKNIKVFKKKNDAEAKVGNLDKYNQLIMAKLMSIGFNIVQFVSSSLVLNQALYNIFRFYKLSTPNRINVIEMIKIQLVSEGKDNLKLDEDLLLNNNLEKYKNLKKEENDNTVKQETVIENKDIKKDINSNIEEKPEKKQEENKEGKKEDKKEDKKEENKEGKKEDKKEDKKEEKKEEIKEENKEDKSKEDKKGEKEESKENEIKDINTENKIIENKEVIKKE